MTIKTKDAEVPSDLPPAKLYLDDIVEIVQLFSRALPMKRDSSGGVSAIVTKFEVGQKQCDDINDLPKIAKQTTNFNLEVRRKYDSAKLYVSRYNSDWYWSGLDDEEVWATARKLQSIFEQRQLRWRKLIDGLNFIPLVVGLLMPLVLLFRNTAKEISAFLVVSAFMLFWFATLRRHSIVVFRYRSDLTAMKDERTEKVFLILATAFISVLGTVLVQFLIHRWWPK